MRIFDIGRNIATGGQKFGVKKKIFAFDLRQESVIVRSVLIIYAAINNNATPDAGVPGASPGGTCIFSAKCVN
jgi:hypothetical protein